MKPPIGRLEELRERNISKKVIQTYWQIFYDLLINLPAGGSLTFEQVYVSASISANRDTARKHLKNYLDVYEGHIGKIVGFYPSTSKIIELAESKVGKLVKTNIIEINNECKNIVDKITLPLHERFIHDSLTNLDGIRSGKVTLPIGVLLKFMYEEYNDFVVGSGNGLVSIAGTMNELILLKALTSDGLEEGKDFVKTGTGGDGDLKIIHKKESGQVTLHAEVKSYRARERFLRGLGDIHHRNKIGIGYFIDASEFNPKRTISLLETQPLAIYLPDKTYQELHADSRSSTTYKGDLLYRKITRFVDDMKAFVDSGTLPEHKS